MNCPINLTRGNIHKLYTGRPKSCCIFTNEIVNVWNSVPNSMICLSVYISGLCSESFRLKLQPVSKLGLNNSFPDHVVFKDVRYSRKIGEYI